MGQKKAEAFDVGGQPRHQIAGSGVIVITERQILQFPIQRFSQFINGSDAEQAAEILLEKNRDSFDRHENDEADGQHRGVAEIPINDDFVNRLLQNDGINDGDARREQ